MGFLSGGGFWVACRGSGAPSNSPPILEPILVGIGMFTGGMGFRPMAKSLVEAGEGLREVTFGQQPGSFGEGNGLTS